MPSMFPRKFVGGVVRFFPSRRNLRGGAERMVRKSGEWCEGGKKLATQCVHAGVDPDPVTGAIIGPIYQNTTFVQSSIEEYMAKGYSYTRSGNPTVRALEKKIAEMEGGYDSVCFATGMAGTCTILSHFLAPGDHCVISDRTYGGTNRACRVHFSKYNIDFSFVDFRDPKTVEAACKSNTKLIFYETPTNPTLCLADVKEITKIAKAKKIPSVCDSTFATPLIMKPLEMGCDMVLTSTTKFYDGHNISVGGAVVSATKELDEPIRFLSNVFGCLMSPQVAFYQLQTTKTLHLRVRQQCESAQKIAEFLTSHPKVESVCYPGLPSFPQKKLADEQHLGGLHGSMLGFEVRGGTEAGRRLMNSVQRPWSLCENLGATESLITCPAVMTHANMLKEDRLKVGVTDGFVRVSVGIEDVDDLLRSLKLALDDL